MSKDLYNILGVSKNASESEIKKAYRKIALECHPDKQAGKSNDEKKKAEDKFKEATKAYDILKDTDKRSKYDKYGIIDGDQQSDGFSSGFNMDDIFRDMGFSFNFDNHGFNPFGNNRSSGQYRTTYEKGQSIQVNLHVSMEELYKGIDKDIVYERHVKCEECQGHGGTGHHTCEHCNGTGQIVNTQRHGFTVVQNITVCPYCNGTGQSYEHECKKCHGTGYKTKKETMHVRLGSPVEGASTRYENMGNSPKGDGVYGDLIVVVVYDDNINKPGSKYQVNNFGTITEQIDVPYYTCILGGEFKTKLPDNTEVKITIPEYSNNSTMVTLRGKGLHHHDYIFKINVKMPTYVNKKEKELLENIKKENK